MMKPMFFNLDNELSLIIIPEKMENEGRQGCNFHLYYSSPGNEEKSLNDLHYYAGLVSFDRASQEFYFLMQVTWPFQAKRYCRSSRQSKPKSIN